jgi:DNA repair ATPase RecN
MLDQETLAKLTTALAGDTELYNTVINEVQTNEAALAEKDTKIKEVSTKLEEAEQRGQNYLGQISNLLSKIPVGNTAVPESFESKLSQVKDSAWTK